MKEEYLYIKEEMREQFIANAESLGFYKIDNTNTDNWDIKFDEYDVRTECNDYFCEDRAYDYEIKKIVNLAVIMFDLFNKGYVAKGVRE